jgi:hypothetical protein
MSRAHVVNLCPKCEKHFVRTLRAGPDFDDYVPKEEALGLVLRGWSLVTSEPCAPCWREIGYVEGP